MEAIESQVARQQKQIVKLQKENKRLQKENEKLQQFYKGYKRAYRNDQERTKELNCMYQIAQCAFIENDIDAALAKIAHIIPSGWQFTKESCARITFQGTSYRSSDFFESGVFQSENISIESDVIGTIELFYQPGLVEGSKDPFLIEEKNLLKGIADIISFYLEKQRDDKNRKLIEQQLLHADRLASVGQLSSGIAHELNEPLGNILGLAQLSLKAPALPEQVVHDLGRIQECVLYSREIIKKLMAFSRQSSLCKEKINLAEVIDNSIAFLEAQCSRENITVVKQYTENITISADPVQIKQVVTNLIINAIQAMKNGGKLTISTKIETANAILLIEDTGIGIPAENVSKAFMPFFTTKDVDEGTGLGLSVVHGIIQNHNGSIKVSSAPGNGTLFEIRLPLDVTDVKHP